MRRLVYLAAALFLAARVHAAELVLPSEPASEPVTVSAAILQNVDENIITAQGSVKAEWGGRVLSADLLSYDRSKRELGASGAVRIYDAATGSDLKCEKLTFRLDDSTAEAEKAHLFIAEAGVSVRAERLKKTGPDTYEAEGAVFTTCDGTWPSWRIEARKISVKIEGYLFGRDGFLYVESMPVTYLPAFVFPAKLKRQSGFLPPRIGNSSVDGFLLKARYYWVINESSDMVIEGDYRSNKGLAESLNLRYVLSDDQRGTAYVKHYLLDGTKENAADFKLDHFALLRPDTVLDAKLDYTGDKTLRADYTADLLERGVHRLENHVSLTDYFSPGSLYGYARYTQSLTEPQEGVLQTLPSLGFSGRDVNLFGPFYSRTDIEGEKLWREEGLRGDRLRMAEGLLMALDLGGISVTAGGGGRLNLYNLENREGAYEKTPSRVTAWAQMGLFADIFRGYGSFDHIIEPRLEAFWEGEGEGDEIPRFDEKDVYERTERLSPRLVTRLFDRGKGSDLLMLDLSRDLDLTIARKDGADDSSAWGPWRALIELNPLERVHLKADGEWDENAKGDGFLRWAASIGVSDARGDSLRIERQIKAGEADYMELAADVNFIGGWSGGYMNRYSVKDQVSLEEGAYVLYRHQCWQAAVNYSRSRLDEEGEYDRVITLTVSLTGFGKVGGLRW